MHRLFNKEEKVFVLELADGIKWGFSATHATLPWLKEFAKIMQLNESDGNGSTDRKLIFLALNNDNVIPKTNMDENWICFTQGKVYRIWEHNTATKSIIELNLDFIGHEEIKYINMSASLKPIFKYYVDNNAGPIHATFAEYKGKGILIAASGGTGKSTCYRRLPGGGCWIPYSDDNALLVKKAGKFMIHPMPTWSDHLFKREFTTFNTSHFTQLSAIFFLEQAQIDEVLPINKNLAVKKVFDSFSQIWGYHMVKMEKTLQIEMNKKIFHTAAELVNEVPCYTLKATLHGRFWAEIEKAL